MRYSIAGLCPMSSGWGAVPGLGETSPCRDFRPSREAEVLKTRLGDWGDGICQRGSQAVHMKRQDFSS